MPPPINAPPKEIKIIPTTTGDWVRMPLSTYPPTHPPTHLPTHPPTFLRTLSS